MSQHHDAPRGDIKQVRVRHLTVEMGRNHKPRTAVIIGAGVGGVATAARLAAAGWKVTVLEKNGFTGGRCSLINEDGYVCIQL